jgi:hypothetical protein
MHAAGALPPFLAGSHAQFYDHKPVHNSDCDAAWQSCSHQAHWQQLWRRHHHELHTQRGARALRRRCRRQRGQRVRDQHPPASFCNIMHSYSVDILVRCVADTQPPKPLPNPSTAAWLPSDGAEIVTLPLVAIAAFTQARLKVLKDLRSAEQRRRMMELLQECCKCARRALYP